jgi:DnaJ-class molecular chaperone
MMPDDLVKVAESILMAPYERQPPLKEVRCWACGGSGIPPLYPLAEHEHCRWCGGTGRILQEEQT